MKGDYCAVLITPDALRDNIADLIIQDIVRAVPNGKVEWYKTVSLTAQDVVTLYPKLVNRPYFPLIQSALTAGNSRVYLISGIRSAEIIAAIKGIFCINGTRIQKTGLRAKYATKIAANISSPNIFLQEPFEFRLHSTDTDEETSILVALAANH